jgi:uncharacterized protein
MPLDESTETGRRAPQEAPYLSEITRVVLRPSASPLPLGFFAIAIATSVLSGLQVRILPSTDDQAVGLVLLCAFVLQIIVAGFAFVDRDTVAATVMAGFAALWLVVSLMFMEQPKGWSDTSVYFLFVFTIFVVMMAIASWAKRALFVVVVVAVPRLFFSGLALATSSRDLAITAGAFGYLLAAVSVYTATALLLEDVHGRTVLPVGRRGAARNAIDGDLAAQLLGVEHSAGVRRSL